MLKDVVLHLVLVGIPNTALNGIFLVAGRASITDYSEALLLVFVVYSQLDVSGLLESNFSVKFEESVVIV